MKKILFFQLLIVLCVLSADFVLAEDNVSINTTCTDECTTGEKMCPDEKSATYKLCGEYDGDGCSEWSSNLVCGRGRYCLNSECVLAGCVDDDGGKNYYVQGTVSWQGFGFETYAQDHCINKTRVGEIYCNEFNESYGAQYNCPYSCIDGACINASQTTTQPTTSEECKDEACLSSELINITSEPIAIAGGACEGCILEKRCYPLGYRQSENYCAENMTFIEQKEGEAACNNSFECESNICIDKKCISTGLLRKIIDWLKSWFGY